MTFRESSGRRRRHLAILMTISAAAGAQVPPTSGE